MSLTCILEIYLRFKGRKWCKLTHFRFWKIKKWLNEEISELRLMDYEERQNEDIMSLGDHKWPLWSKKDGKQTWIMNHEINSSSCMKNWNSKSSGNMYSDFEDKFEVLIEFHFRHTIYCFEAQEVESPTLQIVYKLKLKWRSYDHLKKLCKIEGSFQNDFEIQHMNLNPTYEFEIQLMNLKSNSKWPQFRIHPLSLWCFASSTSGIASRALHPP